MVRLSNSVVFIDEFTARKRGYVYFLSHAHTDHYKGLHNTWDYGLVYCTLETQQVMRGRFPSIAHVFVALDDASNEEGQPIFIGAESKVEIRVWTIDAQHCPGSTMFVLEGYFGNVLYTGDMRISVNTFKDPSFREKNSILFNWVFDELYLDNTHQGLVDIPTREELESTLGRLMAAYPPDTKFSFGGEFGKEETITRLARRLGSKVIVQRAVYDDFAALERYDLLSHMVCAESGEEVAKARCAITTRTNISQAKVTAWNSDEKSGLHVGVLLMGHCIRGRRSVQLDQTFAPEVVHRAEDVERLESLALKQPKLLPRLLLVPFSLHASMSEITTMVSLIKHRRLIGIKEGAMLLPKLCAYELGMSEDRSARLIEQVKEVANDLLEESNRKPTKEERHEQVAAALHEHNRRAKAKRLSRSAGGVRHRFAEPKTRPILLTEANTSYLRVKIEPSAFARSSSEQHATLQDKEYLPCSNGVDRDLNGKRRRVENESEKEGVNEDETKNEDKNKHVPVAPMVLHEGTKVKRERAEFSKAPQQSPQNARRLRKQVACNEKAWNRLRDALALAIGNTQRDQRKSTSYKSLLRLGALYGGDEQEYKDRYRWVLYPLVKKKQHLN